ncbi:PAS domain S-box protein [Roseateles sp. GG27B]
MPTSQLKPSPPLLPLIGLFALYLFFAQLMTFEFPGSRAVGFLWLSSGVALAAVLLKGYRFLVAAFLGALLGDLLIATPISFALLDATRHTAMIFLGAWALKRQSGFSADLERLQDLLHLLAVALACGLFVALLAPVIEWLSGTVGQFSFDQRWTGHILGIAVLAPLVLVWRRWPRHWARPRLAAEAALIIGLSVAAGQVVLLDWQGDALSHVAQGYWLFFLMGWAAIRLGPHGAILVAAIAATQGLLGAQQDIGYFSANVTGDKLENYFFYMLSLTLSGMALATYITELKAQQALMREGLGTLKNFVETTLDGFWKINQEGIIIDINAAYCRISGYSKAEIIGCHISEFIVGLSRYDISKNIENIIRLGRAQFESAHRRKDGSIRNIEVSATCQNPARDELLVILRDITERTQREAQLQQTQDRLSLAQQASGSGLWDLELASGLISWTPECLALLGLTLTPDGQQPGFNDWLSVIHPDDQARAQQTVEAAIQDQATLFCEYRIVLPDGTERWIGAYGNTVHSELGEALHLFGICIDISPQKKAQGQMADGEVFNLAILNSLSAKIAVLDAAGVIVTVNDAWLATENENKPATALPFPDQLIPHTFVGINYLQVCQAGETQAEADESSIAQRAYQGISAVLASRLPSFHLEYPCHTKQQQHWFAMSVTPLVAGTRGVVVSHVDITSIKQAQAELNASQALLQSVVEHMPAGVFWKDQNFRFLGCNTQFANDVGFARKEEIVGKTDFELFESAQAAFYRSSDQAVLLEEASKLDLEILSLAPDGRPIWLNSSKVALRNAEDQVVGILGMYTDITEKKHHSLELEEHRNHLEELVARRTVDLSAARDAAEAANRSKAEFLANMSHEIRSPLNAILGLAYLLEQANLHLAAQTMVRKIRSSGRLLLSLITDILDVSKIEAGQMAIEQAPFHLSDVIDNLAVALGVAVGEKNLELIIHPMPAGVATVLGDALRLQQVLVNLCNNAIKFTRAVGSSCTPSCCHAATKA